jgi:hypothetical protein
VVTTVGAGFLIGHTALAVLMPLALVALGVGYRAHRQPLALGLGGLAAIIAYVHVFGGTPEWTLSLVLAASLLAAIADWRAAGLERRRWSANLFSRVRAL